VTDNVRVAVRSELQNAAARLFTGTRRCDHIDGAPSTTLDTIRQLQGLSVAVGKLAVVGPVPYLADDCRLIVDASERRLCTTENRACIVTQTHSSTSSFDDVQSFCSCRPRTMEPLPSHLRDADLSYSGCQWIPAVTKRHFHDFCSDSGSMAQCETNCEPVVHVCR